MILGVADYVLLLLDRLVLLVARANESLSESPGRRG